MFSRRHPYLYFILVFSFICSATLIVVSLLAFFGVKHMDFAQLKRGKGNVGVIEVTGVISDSKIILHHLKSFRDNPSIKAIVLRIDSPGGAVGPSQEIFKEVRKTIKTKTVIASMGTVAASSGYYIAAGANGIVANAGTITGSIGVIMAFSNFQEIIRKIGLVPIVIKSGEYKDIGSPTREMTTTERNILQGLVDAVHHQFVRDVALGRNLEKKKISSLADGRVYTGEQAKNLELVDRIGNLEDAIEWAGRKGGIKGKISAVYAPEERLPFLKYLTRSFLREIFGETAYPRLY